MAFTVQSGKGTPRDLYSPEGQQMLEDFKQGLKKDSPTFMADSFDIAGIRGRLAAAVDVEANQARIEAGVKEAKAYASSAASSISAAFGRGVSAVKQLLGI